MSLHRKLNVKIFLMFIVAENTGSVKYYDIIRDWILLVCFSWRYEATEGPRVNFVMHEALFEIYTWIPLSLHTSMRNKQVEFNPYIYTLTSLSKLYRFGYEISVFNTKHPVIILRAPLFVVTPSHVASLKIECQIFLMFIVAENTRSVNIRSWMQ